MTRRDNQDIYDFIIQYKAANDGNSPTLESIATHCGIGKTTAFYHVKELAKAGLITRNRGAIQVIGGRWLAPNQVQARYGTRVIRPEFPVVYEEESDRA